MTFLCTWETNLRLRFPVNDLAADGVALRGTNKRHGKKISTNCRCFSSSSNIRYEWSFLKAAVNHLWAPQASSPFSQHYLFCFRQPANWAWLFMRDRIKRVARNPGSKIHLNAPSTQACLPDVFCRTSTSLSCKDMKKRIRLIRAAVTRNYFHPLINCRLFCFISI